MNILSIQSHVSYGHVGNAAAVFPLQLLGHEVWPVHTAQLSNHTGHTTVEGQRFTASQIQEVISGIEKLDLFSTCHAVLSGYLGDAETAGIVADVVVRVKAANPAAIFFCDPVMGDDAKGLYVPNTVADAIKTVLIKKSDVLTPNRFELAQIIETPIETVAHAAHALYQMTSAGANTAVCTSLPLDSRNAIAVIGCDGKDAWAIEIPRLNVRANGAGDCLSAILLARILTEHNLPQSMSLAVSSVHNILKMTPPTAYDLPLVAAREYIIHPSRLFSAIRLDPKTYR